MNKYRIEIIRPSRSNEDYEIYLEAETAKDAIFFAEFNYINKSFDINSIPTHMIYRISAVDKESTELIDVMLPRKQ